MEINYITLLTSLSLVAACVTYSKYNNPHYEWFILYTQSSVYTAVQETPGCVNSRLEPIMPE